MAGCLMTACSGNSQTATTATSTSVTTDQTSAEANTESVSDLSAISDINVEKELFDVTITIPSDYIGETTQDELDKTANENGYKATLNDDGSVTYVMTKKQHEKMVADVAEIINTSVADMIASEDYPNITDITANDDFTLFTITTKSEQPDFAESLSVLAFYTYGGMYNLFNGTTVENIHVEFVNADSGEVISSSDSKDMASE